MIAEKASDELFTIDATGSAEIKKAYHKVYKPLKADEILAQRSAVPALSPRKRAAARTTDGIIEPSSKKKRNGVSHKELDKLRQIAYGGDTVKKDVVKTDGASYDPWETQEAPKNPNTTFIPEKKPIREPTTLKRAPLSLRANGKQVPAVKKPEGGKSYNPRFEDWDELVTREGAKEVAAERARLDAAAADREQLERALATAAEPDPASDDDENESAWESEWEGIVSEPEDALRQRRPQRKTPAERNKAKRRKDGERQARHEAKMRHRDAQAAHIRAIASEVEERERAREGALVPAGQEESSEDETAEEVLRRRKFGRVPVPEAPLEVVLAEELQDSLRLLKPEGNLLKDRYRSMLVRGKMESRRPIAHHKKAKTVITEKWSYKDWKLPKVKGAR